MSFDTLYKQLCSSGQLKATTGETVIAPFAFVSVLAGAFLLANLVARIQLGDTAAVFNDWRINPWRSPVSEMKRCWKKRQYCECCDREEIQNVNLKLWAV
ncbi:MAG: hypothetical protein KDI11_05560 [Alphaproteobacteria bacterium]|nr:hypothetical protein [Alphaproteobacteria bacterium]